MKVLCRMVRFKNDDKPLLYKKIVPKEVRNSYTTTNRPKKGSALK